MAAEAEQTLSDPRESISNLITQLSLGNQTTGQISEVLAKQFACFSALSNSLSIINSTGGGTLVKVGPGYAVLLSVTSNSTGPTGLLYDCAAVANVSSTNAFSVIPRAGMMRLDFPFTNGLVVQPSTNATHTVSVAYI